MLTFRDLLPNELPLFMASLINGRSAFAGEQGGCSIARIGQRPGQAEDRRIRVWRRRRPVWRIAILNRGGIRIRAWIITELDEQSQKRGHGGK